MEHPSSRPPLQSAGPPPSAESVPRREDEGNSSDAGFPDRRLRCPTCRARRRAKEESCYRCGTDLRLLIAIESRADRLYRAACRAYRSGFFRTAASRAAVAVRLEAREEFLRLLSISAVRAGDYRGGVLAARRLIFLRRAAGALGE